MGKPAGKPPSRMKVHCGHTGCDFHGEQRNLKRHMNTKHKGLPIILKNSGFGAGGKWQSWLQGATSCTVTRSPHDEGMLPITTSGPASEESCDDPFDAALQNTGVRNCEKTSAQNAAADIRQDDATSMMESQYTCSGDSCNPTQQLAESMLKSGTEPREAKHLAARMSALEQKTDVMLHLLKKLTGDSAKEPCEKEADVLFRSGRSISNLQAASGQQLATVPAKSLLYCEVCSDEPDEASVRKTGVFVYDFTLGSEFPRYQPMPERFKSLRAAVRGHFMSSQHEKAVARSREAKEKEVARLAESDTVARRVLRAAYYTLKKSLPREKFEDLVYLLHSSGVNVGDKNHSAMLMTKMRDAFHEEMLCMIRRHVATQPCVALAVDKVTLNRRTVDVTAILTVVPDAPPDHMIQSLVIGAPVVKEHDGQSLAEELKATLTVVGVESSKKVASFAADGQYHHLAIPQKLARALNAANADGQTEVAYIPAVWDASHLMNLAEQDARGEPACRWVSDAVGTMTNITKKFSHGKGLEELLDTSDDNSVLTPKLWSNTRFAAHAAKTFKSFRTNSRTMGLVMRSRLKGEKRATAAEELWKDINDLEDDVFKTRLAALNDIYDVLGSGSEKQQNIQLLPWECCSEYGATVERLHDMAKALTDLSKQNSATGEAQRIVNFEELWPNLGKHRVSLKTQVCHIMAFCAALIRNLKARREGAGASGGTKGTSNKKLLECMPYIQRIGDLKGLQTSRASVDAQVRSVTEAIAYLVSRKLMPPSAVASESSVREAIDIIRGEERANSNANQILLKTLWKRGPVVEPFAKMVIRVWLLSPAESVVESMASVLKEVFSMHRQLKHENAAKELMIRWNGPELDGAESLIKAVQRRHHFVFVRRSSNVKHMLTGKVMARHKAARSHRSCLFK